MTVIEGLSSAEGLRRPRLTGFEARRSGTSGLWYDFATYPDDRIGLVIGSCADHAEARRLRAGALSRLQDGADPAEVLRGLQSGTASVLAAVIDRGASLMSYCSIGPAAPALTAPELPHRALRPAAGRLETIALPAGATLLLSTGGATPPDPWPVSNDRIFDHLLTGDSGVVAILYRHPPAPLDLTVPAEPASLAVIRRRLRTWLAMTGAADEMCSDVLLAVGEAATNAAEHAHDDTGCPVQISVWAGLSDGTLRFTVSDNGSWKTPTTSSGHRGHGMRLMRALVDGIDVTTTSEGTTVQMLKELAR